MAPRLRFLLLFIMLSGHLLMLPKQAHACSCDPPRSAKTGGNDVIFAGRVVDDPAFPTFSKAEVATFEVFTVWKGPLLSRLTVYSQSCLTHFEIGEEYLIYSHDAGKGRLEILGMCTQALKLRYAGAELAELGAGRTPPPMPPAPVPQTFRLIVPGSINDFPSMAIGGLAGLSSVISWWNFWSHLEIGAVIVVHLLLFVLFATYHNARNLYP